MNTEIKLLKLYNGEMIIGEEVMIDLAHELKTGYKMNNPRVVGILPTMTGSVQIAMTSVCAPFKVKRLKDYIFIPNEQVMFELTSSEIDSELINGYKSEISGIKIASAADMNAINGAQKSQNDFIL